LLRASICRYHDFGAKIVILRFFGVQTAKNDFFEKKIRILFLHIKCHQKITTYLEFDDRPTLPLPLLKLHIMSVYLVM
jgi:hypothetical protein